MGPVLSLSCCCGTPALSQAEHGPGLFHAQIPTGIPLPLCKACPALENIPAPQLCTAAPPRAGQKQLLCIFPVTPWKGDTSRSKTILLPGVTF